MSLLLGGLGPGGGGCGCCGSTPTLTCSPCNIPLADLTISWSGGTFGTDSMTMAHSTFIDAISGDTIDQWTATRSFTFGGQGTHDLVFSLTCQSGTMLFSVSVPDGGVIEGSCLSDLGSTVANSYVPEVPADRGCSPLHLHFTATIEPAETFPNCRFLWCPGCVSPRSYIKDIYIDG